MTDSTSTTQFQAMAAAAESGELRLSGDAAERCARACRDYIDGLDRLRRGADRLVRLESFGDLESAQQLGKKFFDLAVGSEGSFEDIVQKHIDTAMQMEDMFIKAGAAYRATEESNTQGLGAAGSAL
ncbi:hypothetical protein G4H71_18510 [Rhodococcus triatomae]|uniref:Excreted virulence factor EspC, type VII ESX diderm n=1 Tax=Rhodococcus triatomae TaxID=300028 RepID=A0A1G8EWA1_9NOCA|nr:hypothetical protein [Rhodococcus triatomae]QNG19314.1 hypothetical protein G4H72_11865 [Rhodococcus triatomae]QNG24773.1 hypothetical protein G4H71_18510 [Rhodococcus triatomae]SDH74181.1 hypothetical protein SAMN05444695_10386 [Rhodococcus triatomae]